jgi:hypothetical protein
MRENIYMSDKVVAEQGEGSPEYVALKLMRHIATADGYGFTGMAKHPPREWIILTYAACLQAVKDPHAGEIAVKLLPPKP